MPRGFTFALLFRETDVDICRAIMLSSPSRVGRSDDPRWRSRDYRAGNAVAPNALWKSDAADAAKADGNFDTGRETSVRESRFAL
jgi:hypothetical protein